MVLFLPHNLIGTGTKEQCIDKAKESFDILAPGGNYFILIRVLNPNDINPENYVAVLEYVWKTASMIIRELVTTAKREDSIQKYSHLYPKFESKYIVSFEEFKKEYPPVDPRIEPLMRAAYEKYTNIVDRSRFM